MSGFYGENLFILESALKQMLTNIDLIKCYCKSIGMHDPIEHFEGRIKTEESMIEKLHRKGLEPTIENALTKIHDAVGVRIICSFVDDVYTIVNMVRSMEGLEIFEEKDYIANPKPNGYRSFHIIVFFNVNLPGETKRVPIEIQIRTIAQDCWAALEHSLHYKKEIKNVELIQDELKRCAEEMASTDLTMQTVRQMINGEI
ncbi:GTP pyrophosphokinase family protein [Ruminococcus sp. YE282]|uniref:GTP pyrophosphokinase n=1 Tax=Ruminococcus sp. YE282 TaxID=3158780 RepID=UPI000884A9B2|nr:GTP pyrophosphokinase family protein [Ruminococcus bromii]MDD6433625.1 GTP pyrophosphokinase family protein [Ruminococcus bromii]MDY4084572.1 GTP pyrophosphokinase family protein [Ruminococcus bromii]MDY4711974.1 GTP pyrophosphokinase family protein [Ruminococcus bromii]MEE0963267.1 GTP pyrophosphokinase family protein [Ruminococcus bromii]